MNILIIHRYFWPESISTLPIMFRDVVNFHLENDDTVKAVSYTHLTLPTTPYV